MAQLWLTGKIHSRLKEIAESNRVEMEGLGNILLLLGMSDPEALAQVVSIIRTMGIGGSQDLENKLG